MEFRRIGFSSAPEGRIFKKIGLEPTRKTTQILKSEDLPEELHTLAVLRGFVFESVEWQDGAWKDNPLSVQESTGFAGTFARRVLTSDFGEINTTSYHCTTSGLVIERHWHLTLPNSLTHDKKLLCERDLDEFYDDELSINLLRPAVLDPNHYTHGSGLVFAEVEVDPSSQIPSLRYIRITRKRHESDIDLEGLLEIFDHLPRTPRAHN